MARFARSRIRGSTAPASRQAYLGVAGAVILILCATLVPLERSPGGGGPQFTLCIMCGRRAAADVVLNILLFAPLGAALAAAGRTGFLPVLYGGLLSLGIELTQFLIPGRDPSLSDICFNTLGTALGQVALRASIGWRAPSQRLAARLSLAASLTALILVGLTGLLFKPAFPPTAYRPQWRSERDAASSNGGFLLDADLASEPLLSQSSDNSLRLRGLLLAGARLRIQALTGPAGLGSGRLFTIRDDHHREILFIGVDQDGRDLLLRYRTLGTAWRLEQSDWRIRGALNNIPPGDTVLIEVQRRAEGFCFQLNGTGQCPLGPTVASGWTLLLYPEGSPAWFQVVLNVAWMAALALPIGFWSRQRAESWVAGGILLATLLLLPGLLSLLPTPPLQWLGAAGGYALGLMLQRRLSRPQPIVFSRTRG